MKIVVFSFVLILFLDSFSLGDSLHKKGIHSRMAEMAVEVTGIPYLKRYKDLIVQGAFEEDLRLEAPAGSLSHGFNPITGEGFPLPGAIPSMEESPRLWDRAVEAYLAGRIEEAFFLLGRCIHHIQDMSVPAHVHLDLHFISPGDDFEVWGVRHFKEYDFHGLAPLFPAGISLEEILRNVALETYQASSFEGVLVAKPGPQPPSELLQMFPSLKYKKGIFGIGGYWVIDNVGTYGGILGQFGTNEWWPLPEDHQIEDGPDGEKVVTGKFYIENSAGDDGFLTSKFYRGEPNNKPLLRIYGDLLYPLAVYTSAGILLKFIEENGVFVPRGISLLRTSENIKKVSHLFDLLGGEEKVNFIVVAHKSGDGWLTFIGEISRGSSADQNIQKREVIVVLKNSVFVRNIHLSISPPPWRE